MVLDFLPGELLRAMSVLESAVVFSWESKPGTKVTVLSKQSADAASPAVLEQCVGWQTLLAARGDCLK